MLNNNLIDTSFKEKYSSSNQAKTECLEKLKKAKVRMSKQRMEIIDLLFEGSFNCTKELYYEAQERNPELGMSSVYRFLKVLADQGIISKSKMLDVNCKTCDLKQASLKGKDGATLVDNLNLHELLRLGLIVKGVISSDEKINVTMVDDEINISLHNN